MDLSNYGYSTPFHSLEGYSGPARVVDVYDGDTVQIVLDERGVVVKANCRVSGIDTCEMRTRNADAKALAKRARDCLLSKITNVPEGSYTGLSRSRVRKALAARCKRLSLKRIWTQQLSTSRHAL